MNRVFIVVLMLGLLSSSTASAKPNPNELFNQALDLARKGATSDAVDMWLEVLGAVEARYQPSVHQALGMGYGSQGMYPEAAYHISLFLQTRMEAEATETRERLKSIEGDLQKTHRKVTIACEPGEATVFLNETGDGTGYTCPFAWWFANGSHVIRAEKVGYLPVVAEVDVSSADHQQLQTVVMEPAEPLAKESTAEQMKTIGRIRKAAKNGHEQLLRKLARQHGDLFKGLACEHAWDPAVTGVWNKDCRSGVVMTLVDAGVEICPTVNHIKKSIALGCTSLVGVLLANAPDKDVVTAVSRLSFTSRYNPTVQQAVDLLATVDVVEERLKVICNVAGIGSQGCKAIQMLDENLREFYKAIVTRVDADTLVAILAKRPSRARENNCVMTAQTLDSVMHPDACKRVSESLPRFYQKGAQECRLTHSIKAVIGMRCYAPLAVVAEDVMPEDLADATEAFNLEDRFLPRLLVPQAENLVADAIAVGQILVAANKKFCQEQGAGSPNCQAVRFVEGEMKRIKGEQTRIYQTENLLKELCLVQGDLDTATTRLNRAKREGELSGFPNRNELSHVAKQIVNFEQRRDLLAPLYKKAARKSYQPTLCQ
jgi:hypothetical protein